MEKQQTEMGKKEQHMNYLHDDDDADDDDKEWWALCWKLMHLALGFTVWHLMPLSKMLWEKDLPPPHPPKKDSKICMGTDDR